MNAYWTLNFLIRYELNKNACNVVQLIPVSLRFNMIAVILNVGLMSLDILCPSEDMITVTLRCLVFR